MKNRFSFKHNKALNQALSYCQQNRFKEAKTLYLELVKTLPNHPDVLTNLGTIEIQLGFIKEGIYLLKKSLEINPFQSNTILNLANAFLELNRNEEAVEFFNRAIYLNPKNAENYYNKGRALRGLSDFEGAILCYTKALDINPFHFMALNNRGFVYNLRKEFELALIDFDKAIKINPNFAEAYLNKGIALEALEKYQEAIFNFNAVIHINPENSQAYSRLGNVLDKIYEYEAAIESFDKAILYEKNFAEPYNGRAHALYKLKLFDRALEDYDKALILNPNYYEALINKSVILLEKKKYSEALQYLDKAIKLKPNRVEGYTNKAQIYIETEKHDLALAEFEKGFNLSPDYNKLYYNAALLYLRNKRFDKGWDFYEKRTSLDKYKSDLDLSQHGERLTNLEVKGKRILIVDEQGIGDQILYLSLIRELDADNNKIIVLVDPRLIDLFKRSCPKIEFISKLTPTELVNIDYYSLSGNLGGLLRRSIEDFKSQPHGYLKSNKLLTERLKIKLKENNKIICGLAWKSKNENVGIDKSVSLNDFLPILRLEGISFINLQYGETEQERKEILEKYDIKIKNIDEIDNFNDIDGLTSLVDACDIVVTTSNATAHIAGALNKTTFLIVPMARGRIWYWHDNVEKSLWYPSIEQIQMNADRTANMVIDLISHKIKERILC